MAVPTACRAVRPAHVSGTSHNPIALPHVLLVSRIRFAAPSMGAHTQDPVGHPRDSVFIIWSAVRPDADRAPRNLDPRTPGARNPCYSTAVQGNETSARLTAPGASGSDHTPNKRKRGNARHHRGPGRPGVVGLRPGRCRPRPAHRL